MNVRLRTKEGDIYQYYERILLQVTRFRIRINQCVMFKLLPISELGSIKLLSFIITILHMKIHYKSI